jgi:MOSC domain-containing protein YiiM
MRPTVIAVCSQCRHGIGKDPKTSIDLVAGLGVEGDAHFGRTTQHLYLLRKDPARPNLTQVHLLHAELHDRLNHIGFDISPGMLGENITTRGLDLTALPSGTRLKVGNDPILQVTGYRQPCSKLDRVKPRLMDATFIRDSFDRLIPDLGIMAIVLKGGVARMDDSIEVIFPDQPHLPLLPV